MITNVGKKSKAFVTSKTNDAQPVEFDPPDPKADPIGFVEVFRDFIMRSFGGQSLSPESHRRVIAAANEVLEPYRLGVVQVVSHRDGSIMPHFREL